MSITSDLRGFALACDEQTKKTLLMAADRIDAEHAKLRERVHELEMEGSRAFYNESYTNDENRRLRELVRDMYAAFVHGNCYRWCEFKDPCNYIDDGKCQWYDRMAELGVEVEK